MKKLLLTAILSLTLNAETVVKETMMCKITANQLKEYLDKKKKAIELSFLEEYKSYIRLTDITAKQTMIECEPKGIRYRYAKKVLMHNKKVRKMLEF